MLVDTIYSKYGQKYHVWVFRKKPELFQSLDTTRTAFSEVRVSVLYMLPSHFSKSSTEKQTCCLPEIKVRCVLPRFHRSECRTLKGVSFHMWCPVVCALLHYAAATCYHSYLSTPAGSSCDKHNVTRYGRSWHFGPSIFNDGVLGG